MIIYDAKTFPQGSSAWVKKRLGKVTASEFHKIVTPTGKLSSQADKYAYRLIAEELMGQPAQDLSGLEWIERGVALEPRAVQLYEFEHDVITTEIGSIFTDDGEIGCSPDRLVGSDGLLEIKCCSPQVHIQYMIEGPDEKYRPQVQGQLLVSERRWADFLSYNPFMPRVLVRTPRDEPYIALLRKSLIEFVAIKKEMMAKILSMGAFTFPEPIIDVAEKELGKTAGEEYGPDDYINAG